MHASTVRSFIAFMPALDDHDKREELTALTGCRSRSSSATATSSPRSGTAGSWPTRCPTPTLHVVERTGHMLTQERPQLVTDAIGRLLAAATAGRTAA